MDDFYLITQAKDNIIKRLEETIKLQDYKLKIKDKENKELLFENNSLKSLINFKDERVENHPQILTLDI
jgi:hypothetical protein